MEEDESFLWLTGFTGSGKSVLCSTVIQFTYRQRKYNPQIGIAFFYFTFRDDSKQDDSAMLRAVLLQLSAQRADGYEDLNRLHNSYQSGLPPSHVMIQYLEQSIRKFHRVYIILDALDESPKDGPRGKVLDTLDILRKIPSLRLLVTSRDESDIRDSLIPSAAQEVKMESDGVAKDIRSFVDAQLDTDKRLKKWFSYRDKIANALATRAKGGYVHCLSPTVVFAAS